MKILKGASIFAFFAVLFGSCFDPPEFPNTPQIEIEGIEFIATPGISEPDTLMLYVNFKDGDGDLGLTSTQIDDPYHEVSFFLEDGTGQLVRASTQLQYSNLPPFIKLSEGQNGKLATVRTRQKPNYGSLPPYISPYTCTAYLYDTVYVTEDDKHIFDNSYNIFDTLKSPGFPNVYMLLDTFYIEINPNHYNFEVDFLVKRVDNLGVVHFDEFDWRTEFCTTYDGRFPVLADKTRPLEGTLRYSMTSTGFVSLFSVKTMKLRVQIKDRALNKSNITETREFTLDQIRRN